ncbi:YopX family protein [Tuberibacillus sp. Marseille-P3662]|uniref:YopX family protein n=1 Tax=Tuberibacillus sp. Marseille-P3662 TaxID=1965358 RepID=UPI000A1CBB25|nr:YopX family protein [Tuberibacillus sp. Marseille-P3662]
MSNIKFRYIVRHKASGNIETKHYFLSQIEERPLKELSPAFLADYELLSRDQYTGLRDKNGVEVYDDDLINSQGGIYRVRYVDGSYYAVKPNAINTLHFYLDYKTKYNVEVIGNVHENPDLLEGGE